MTSVNKIKASLSLDLDNQWSYMKTHGDSGWETFPSYLDLLIPRVLELLDKHNLKITFFIVGQDAVLDKNADALWKIAKAGHEVGNHSFHHEPWLHLYNPEEIEAELEAAENAIKEATGERPRGFRGPGFSLSLSVLEKLKKRNYRYDASTFPTFIGPLARAYYFLNARLPKEEREKRKLLFGSWLEGMRPLKPYHWNLPSGPLFEFPVTTIPIFRAPFHLSYICYLSGYSTTLARYYFNTALNLCRITGVEPSLLLHPLDFISGDDIEELKFFPGMSMSSRDKLNLIDNLFQDYCRKFQVLPMGEHVNAIQASTELSLLKPKFSRLQSSYEFQL